MRGLVPNPVHLRVRPRKLLSIGAVSALLAVVVLGAWAGASVASDPPVATWGHLPSPRYHDPAFLDTLHNVAYVVGGAVGLDEIVRVDLATGASEVVARLPGTREGPCLAWDPIERAAYVFFGWTGGSFSNQIVRFSPDTTTVQVVATAPQGNSHCTAFWDDQARKAYVLGGDRVTMTAEIARFDPGTASYEVLASKLPSGRSHMGQAAWDANKRVAYVAGGWLGGDARTDEIVRFAPSTGAVTVVGHLPRAANGVGVVWVDGALHLFGGAIAPTDWVDTVHRFDPASGETTLLPTRLPSRTSEMGIAALSCRTVFLFGGSIITEGGTLAPSDRILRYLVPDQSTGCAVDTFLQALAGTETRILGAINDARSESHVEHAELSDASEAGHADIVAVVGAGHLADADRHQTIEAAVGSVLREVQAGNASDGAAHQRLATDLERQAEDLSAAIRGVLQEIQDGRTDDATEHAAMEAALDRSLQNLSAAVQNLHANVRADHIADAAAHERLAETVQREARALAGLVNDTSLTLRDGLARLLDDTEDIRKSAHTLAQVLREQRASEPLSLQVRSADMPGGGLAGEHWVLVSLRGTRVDADLHVTVLGNPHPEPRIAVIPVERGIYVVRVLDLAFLQGHAFLLEAQVGEHRGNALLGDGTWGLPFVGLEDAAAPAQGVASPAEEAGG